jgi:hypothetical protein
LIGSSIAIGLRHGKGLSCVPLEEKSQREKAIAEVNDLYRDFIDNFKYSDCQTLIQCDFSKPGEPERFREDKLYEGTCVRFFNHLMTRFVEADKKSRNLINHHRLEITNPNGWKKATMKQALHESESEFGVK